MQAIYYRGADGTEPVNAYLRALKGRREPNLKNQIARLNLLGPSEHLPIEYSKQVEGELRELRCHYGNELYRIYYRRSGNLFVLLHIIRKLGARLPEAETAIARHAGVTSRRVWTRSLGLLLAPPDTTRLDRS